MTVADQLDTLVGMTPRTDKEWGVEENITVNSGVVHINYPAGSASPLVHTNTGAPLGGGQRLWYFDQPCTEAAVEYKVFVPAGFNFVKGGKLGFGLWGGDNFDGGKRPDGTDGVSSRIMWRADGFGEIYAYTMEAPEGSIDTGKGFSIARGSFIIPTGTWTTFGVGIKLNTPGVADGRMNVTMNGEPIVAHRGVKIRAVESLMLEGIILSSFFGGGDTEWTTPVDTYTELKDIKCGRTGLVAAATKIWTPQGQVLSSVRSL